MQIFKKQSILLTEFLKQRNEGNSNNHSDVIVDPESFSRVLPMLLNDIKCLLCEII